ncbi:Hypothetical protein PFCIRM123_07265 [Propionibacterium freudenreichii]|nr:Hypothetical protein PFCIRM123_07265 [Propionibacterium freudenreichii]
MGSRLGGETDPVATYRRLSEERDHSDSLLPFVDVDWVAVARDYDAVHLSIGGYLLGAWAPIQTDHGLSTLAGWQVWRLGFPQSEASSDPLLEGQGVAWLSPNVC